MPTLPETQSGRWKRRFSDNMADLTGRRFCTSCRGTKPVEEFKLIRRNNVSMYRCTKCIEFRKNMKKERKNAQ